MEHQDIRTLRVLEAFEGKESPSQRELSKKLNISLGLVNSYIKGLTGKGYFKVKNIPQKRRIQYTLTSKGITEKTRLAYKYIRYSFDFYNEAKMKLHNIFNDVTFKNRNCRLILCGANELAEIAYISMQAFPIDLLSIVDLTKHNQHWLNMPVKKIDSINNQEFDQIIVTHIKQNETAYHKLLEIGIDENRIIKKVI